ncbi:MAG: hypothetical protein QG608_3242 [Actinomycetota bacterium]|nr:hypothetical protein [Actinomycetota bacterium]
MNPARPADAGYAAGRRRKSIQFLTAAEIIMELADDGTDIGDAYVTLCVHAGIAAADAMCAHHLGQHNSGENHHEAVALLKRVHPEGRALATDLSQLLSLKTRAGYTHRPVTAQDRCTAGRRAERLVDAARSLPL